MEHLRTVLPPSVRINTLKASEDEILRLLTEEGVVMEPVADIPFIYKVKKCAERLGNLRAYFLGYIYPQALSSALPVLALAPKPGDLVLDMCAAPGGKTTYMSQLMGDKGTIVANDRKMGRLTALSANIKRLGITNCIITSYRGTNFPAGERFDRILVDAPCSGEGRYRVADNGSVVNRVTGKTDLTAIQKGLLVKAFDLLRPEGRLVYSTCTINPKENEEVVNHLLTRRPSARLVRWNPPVAWHSGLTKYKEKEYDPSCKLCRRFYPHEIDSVGFFVATIGRAFD